MPDNGLPAGWRRVPLREVATIVMGQAPPGSAVVDWNGTTPSKGLPFIQGNAEFTNSHPAPVKWCSDPAKIAQAGDTLISVRAPVGEMNFADRKLAIGRGVAAVRFTGVDGRFGWHQVARARATFSRISQGSTFTAINSGDLAELELLAPPPDEQRRIAEVLDSIDAAIEKTEAVIAATERLRSALLGELLTRGVPGWHTEWKQVPGIGTIPACWGVMRLGDCGKWLSGGTPSKSRADFWVGSLPWVSPKDMKVRIISDAEDHISAEAASRLRIIQAGALLVVVRGMILAHSFPVGMTSRDVTFNQDMRALLCGTGIVPGYLLACLESRRDSLVRLATPSTHGTMRVVSEELFDVQVPKPDEREQERICESITALDERIKIERDLLAELSTLKRAVGEALLSGQLRVFAKGRA
jgi:type I restriction enzyme S subunit